MAENSDISHEYESYELEMTFRGLLLPDEELIWCKKEKKQAFPRQRSKVSRSDK